MTTTFRADEGLAFLLQYENVAWYDAGEVRILDRRVYPAKTEFVTCRTHGEVAQAIRDMVTQSAGPYTAAAMGMALAAYECREKTEAEQLAFLATADGTISNARPTTAKRMKLVCDGCLEAAKLALREGRPLDLAIREHAVNANNRRYSKVNEIAKYLVPLIPTGGTVMTQCFGETIVGMMLKEAKLAGKDFRLFCPETRPYFQGARLTATVCRDMGFDVTVITDNMPAFVMEREHVDLFTCAADAICLDGYVVNKVGTLQIAICANHFGIPTFVTGAPDIGHETKGTVRIEMRDPDFTLQAMGVRTAAAGVKGYYPAFDMTPPHLISGIVTDRGVNACPPLAIGVGIGGCITTATHLSKKALLRKVGSHNPNPKVAEFENILSDAINKIGVGPQGLGGSESLLGLNVETICRHPATLAVSVSTGCWAHRRATLAIDKDGNCDMITHKGAVI